VTSPFRKWRKKSRTLCFLLLLSGFAASFSPLAFAQLPAEIVAHSTRPAPPLNLRNPDDRDHRSQAYSLPPDKLAKAIAFSRTRQILELIDSLWGLAVIWLLLALGIAAKLAAWIESRVRNRWRQGLLFFATLLILLTLADLPLDWYGHRVSLAYGISVQSWSGWAGDLAKSLGLTLLFGAPLMLLFHRIVRSSPRHYWFWAWTITLPLMVLATLASPLLEPIFDQFEPLAKNHPALVAKLQSVVARTGTRIPPERMFLVKASLKSNGLNAYVTGIGATKRIVVWDTTAGRIPDDEVLFIFGHESGHYVLNHIPKGLACSAVGLFFLYWGCAGFAAWLAVRYGSGWGIPAAPTAGQLQGHALLSTHVGFVVLLFAVSTAGFVLEPVSNTFSRYFEHEADIYGQEAIHGLVPDPRQTTVAAFNHLGEAWLEDPNPSPFLEFWTYSHPSTQHRADFAAHYDPWAGGGHGIYFDK
jgi:Zn-dependent protease with chaperone function